MERRAEQRTTVTRTGEVWVEILGQGDAPSVHGRLVDLSGAGARLECDSPVRPGSAVKIQWDEELWLAEAVYSLESNGKWSVGLKVRQRLTRLAELRKVMAGLVGSPTRGASCRPLAGARF